MSKRGFLTLNDDNFWGNESEKSTISCSEESIDSITAEKKRLARESDEDGECREEDKVEDAWDEEEKGWEDVKGDQLKKSDARSDIGDCPFGNDNNSFGGFGRTNANSYYDDQKLARKPSRPHSRFPIDQELDREMGFMKPERDKWNRRKDDDERKEIGETYSALAQFEYNQGSERAEQKQQKRRSERPDVNVMDERYVEYYEYLCRGINRLLDSETPLYMDCGARSSYQQSGGACRALKSKYYYQYSTGPEVYSRKVFVGGLPIDVDEELLIYTFERFGPLVVDWPNKNETRTYYPPKGYVFLIFEHETSVRELVSHCLCEDEKFFLFITSNITRERLKVQIRPWRLADSDYLVDVSVPINLRRVVFVGGVPRPIRAVELAHIMDGLYGSVASAGIDTDVEYKYPKGAGRVAFTNYNSYMRAITDRYALLSHGDVEKRVEMKPYVLDDQVCEECSGEFSGGRHAPFFCPHLECLQYYCEVCWTEMHGSSFRENHKPLVKEA